MMDLYYLRDNIAEKSAPPFAAPNRRAALRMVRGMKFPPGTQRGDFTLYYFCSFDENLPAESTLIVDDVFPDLGEDKHEAVSE